MQFNRDPGFVGIEKLKETHASQIDEFKQWASKNDWERFHYSHYDWWTFPINLSSAYGVKWTVYEGDIAELKTDPQFVANYITGVRLVSASWGWDLDANKKT